MHTPTLQAADPRQWQQHRFGLGPERWERLRGRSFWITGAGTGLGQALSVALGLAGSRVILSGRREARLQETIEQAASLGADRQGFLIQPLDLLDTDAILAACAAVTQACGRIDGLVHCAALAPSGHRPLLEASPASWELLHKTNVEAAWLLSRTLLPQMLQGPIRILLLSSEAGWSSTAGYGLYNLSKAAVNSLGHCLASEAASAWPQEDIQINVLVPGQFHSQMNTGSQDSPFAPVSMALILLSHPPGGPNGRFFHRDGRHLGFCDTPAYPFSCQG